MNNPTYFILLRLDIGLELLKNNYEVYIAGPGKCPDILLELGFKFHPIPMSRKGKNILHEIITIVKIIRLFLNVKPNIVHLVTVKPYLYGGIAARLSGVPLIVSAVTGLGSIFIGNKLNNKLLRSILWVMYRWAFGAKNQKIIFQNSTDEAEIRNWVGFDKSKSVLIKGSGVDLEKYKNFDEPSGVPVVTFVGRFLVDKGILEFIEASKILKKRGIRVRMCLVGEVDVGNPSSLKEKELDKFIEMGIVESWGFQENINDAYAKSNIACLPSYREGLPKSLIEAAASSRAVITTDVPGCKDAILPGVSGVLVPVKDPSSLAEAIIFLIENELIRKNMGRAGRLLAEKEFSIVRVVESHMEIYRGLGEV